MGRRHLLGTAWVRNPFGTALPGLRLDDGETVNHECAALARNTRASVETRMALGLPYRLVASSLPLLFARTVGNVSRQLDLGGCSFAVVRDRNAICSLSALLLRREAQTLRPSASRYSTAGRIQAKATGEQCRG